MKFLSFNDHELTTLLAALRCEQGGSTQESFALIQRITDAPDAPILAITMEGGLVDCVVSNHPETFANLSVMVIDYDVEGGDPADFTDVPQGGEDEDMQAVVSVTYVGLAAIDLPETLRRHTDGVPSVETL